MHVKLGNARILNQQAYFEELEQPRGLRLVTPDERLRILAHRRAQQIDRLYIAAVASGILILLLMV